VVLGSLATVVGCARPLTADEETVLLGYLHAHATDAGGSS
jgi:hypothetical protein